MKKTIIKSLCIMLMIAGVPCTVQAEERNAEFDAFLDEQFRQLMEEDYVTMHFKIQDYTSYGMEKPEVTFGTIDLEEENEEFKEAVKKLQDFDTSSFTVTQYQDYLAVKDSYEATIESDTYAHYYWLFTPSNNSVQGIMQNLVEFPFYTREDYFDYVTLLNTSVSYLEQALALTEKQVEQGYFMNDLELEESLQEIQDVCSKKEDNPIIKDFQADVNAADVLTDGEKADLQMQVSTYILESFLPECEKIYTTLQGFKGKGFQGSDYLSDEGKQYYEAVLQQTSSTSHSPEKQLKELSKFIKEQLSVLMDNMSDEDVDISLSDSEVILQYLEKHVRQSDLPQIDGYTYKVDYIDPSVVAGNTAAYYLLPRIDNYQDNVIKVNPDTVENNVDLYGTLAHEGFPGHLYQNVYYYSTSPHPIRTVLSYTGYEEGWAQFAELMAYDFILNAEDAAYEQANTKISYALIAAIEIGVNYKGWDEDGVRDFMESLNLNGDSADYYYELALKYPYVYSSYGYGMMRFCNMEEDVKLFMGSEYNQKEFIQILLNDGPRSFEQIQDQLDTYTDPYVFQGAKGYLLGIGGGLVLVTGLVTVFVVHRRKKRKQYGA